MEARNRLAVNAPLRAQARRIEEALLDAVQMTEDVAALALEGTEVVEDPVVALAVHLVDQETVPTLPQLRRMHVTAKFGSASGDVDTSSLSPRWRFAALDVMPTL